MTDPKPLDPSTWDPAAPLAEDFYSHVNRAWLSANPVPPEYPMWGASIELDHRNKELTRDLLQAAADDAAAGTADAVERLVGDYFASGMDVDAIAAAGAEPLRPLLDRIAAIASLEDLRALLVDWHATGLGPYFAIGVEADFEDARRYLAYVQQAGLGLPEKSYYLNDDEASVALRAAYRAHIAAQLRNLGEAEDEAAATAGHLVAFETRLADLSLSREEQRDPRTTMNRFRVEALDEVMPGMRLASLLRETGVGDETVSVQNPRFLAGLDGILADTPLDVLKGTLRWHLVRATASSLAPAFENEAFAFYGRTLGGQQEQQPRWKRIVGAATSDLGEAVGQLFVRVTFPPEAKARVETLVDHLLSAMGKAIRDNAWMTEATREQALVKLAGFSCKIGYPDAWRDYSSLVMDRGSYMANRLAAAAFEQRRQLQQLGSPMDRGEWAMPPHVVNAYYHPLLNEIVFPAGILQPPFFWREADDAVNYGGIGTVIGHEITHGFDDTGSRFDADGALRDWWTEEDRTEFERRAAVLVGQFDAYEILEGVNGNGRLTLGENIADLGGIAVSLDAMREVVPSDAPLVDGLTPEQRFFAAYATMWRMNTTEQYARLLANIDTHAPSRYRVNGPLANTPAFAAAFTVPEGAPMALPAEARAKVW